jgi:hypothetical protein
MRVEARVVGQIKIDPNEIVKLDHVEARGTDYSGRKLRMLGAIGSRLEHCRFNNAQVGDACFGAGREMSEYIECSFDGARVYHASGFARFVRCSFKNIDFCNWLSFGTEIIDCVFTGRMQTCIFNGTVMKDFQSFLHRERNEFLGNDFSGVDFVDVTFRTGIDLTKQRLPSGPEYLYLPDAAASVARAKSAAQHWDDSELRKQVLSFLESLYFELEGGQRQLLLRVDEPTAYPSATNDKVFALLRGN